MTLQRIRGSRSGFISSGYKMPRQLGFQRSSTVTLASAWPGAEHICCGRWTHGLDRLPTEAGRGWWDRSEEGWRGNRGVGGLDLTLEARAAWTSVPLFYPHQLTSPPPHTNTHYSVRAHTHTDLLPSTFHHPKPR